MSREKLMTLEITCSNPACPTPEKVVVLTGKARKNAAARASTVWAGDNATGTYGAKKYSTERDDSGTSLQG
jgi:hypothetical protein